MDAKGNPKDGATVLAGEETLPPGEKQPSGEKPEPSALPELSTKEQVEKLLGERHSKLDKRILELEKLTVKSTKALGAAAKRATDAETALSKWQKERDEAEEQAIQDDEPALKQYRARKRNEEKDAELSRREQELAANKTEHEEALREHQDWKRNQLAAEIASKYEGLEPSLLLRLTDGSREKMELLAGEMGTLKATQSKTPQPDSGSHSGGGGKLTEEQIEKMSPEDYAKHPSVVARFK